MHTRTHTHKHAPTLPHTHIYIHISQRLAKARQQDEKERFEKALQDLEDFAATLPQDGRFVLYLCVYVCVYLRMLTQIA